MSHGRLLSRIGGGYFESKHGFHVMEYTPEHMCLGFYSRDTQRKWSVDRLGEAGDESASEPDSVLTQEALSI